ncbi:hypothetical protein GCM10027062_11910 [Nocardioides hungaricus]
MWFGIQHLGLLAGILALRGAGVPGAGRARGIGVWLAAAGMALLTVTELLAVTARDADLDQYAYLNVLYSIAIRRGGGWSGWRGWVVLVTGIWVFVPMIPAPLELAFWVGFALPFGFLLGLARTVLVVLALIDGTGSRA